MTHIIEQGSCFLPWDQRPRGILENAWTPWILEKHSKHTHAMQNNSVFAKFQPLKRIEFEGKRVARFRTAAATMGFPRRTVPQLCLNMRQGSYPLRAHGTAP